MGSRLTRLTCSKSFGRSPTLNGMWRLSVLQPTRIRGCTMTLVTSLSCGTIPHLGVIIYSKRYSLGTTPLTIKDVVMNVLSEKSEQNAVPTAFRPLIEKYVEKERWGTSPSPSEGGEPPKGHSLIWLEKLFFLLSSPYLLKSLTLFIKVPHTICSISPPYLFNIPTLFIKVPHVICSTSPPYLLYSYTPSTFVIMSFCLQKNICLSFSLCHYVGHQRIQNLDKTVQKNRKEGCVYYDTPSFVMLLPRRGNQFSASFLFLSSICDVFYSNVHISCNNLCITLEVFSVVPLQITFKSPYRRQSNDDRKPVRRFGLCLRSSDVVTCLRVISKTMFITIRVCYKTNTLQI